MFGENWGGLGNNSHHAAFELCCIVLSATSHHEKGQALAMTFSINVLSVIVPQQPSRLTSLCKCPIYRYRCSNRIKGEEASVVSRSCFLSSLSYLMPESGPMELISLGAVLHTAVKADMFWRDVACVIGMYWGFTFRL